MYHTSSKKPDGELGSCSHVSNKRIIPYIIYHIDTRHIGKISVQELYNKENRMKDTSQKEIFSYIKTMPRKR